MKCIQNEIPFEIPESWMWIRLGSICDVRNGATPRRDTKEFWENGSIPWFTIEDKHEQGVFINYTKQHITKIAMSNDRIVPKDSVLLCCTASVGEVAYTNIDITSNQQFNGISVKYEYKQILSPHYLLTYAFTLKEVLKKVLATATTFGFVSVSKIEQLLIPIPPYNEQITIVNKYNELYNYVDCIIEIIYNINKIKAKLKMKVIDSIFSPDSSYKSYYEKDFNLGDILEYEQPAPYIVKNTDYNDNFDTPVLTPGKTFILGYTNEKDGIYKANKENKVIIFDDFTTASRLVDFDFKVKSSAMKILHISDKTKFDIDYMYYLLQTINIIVDTHKRFWISEYAPLKVKIHTFDEQIKIKNKIKSIFVTIDNI